MVLPPRLILACIAFVSGLCRVVFQRGAPGKSRLGSGETWPLQHGKGSGKKKVVFLVESKGLSGPTTKKITFFAALLSLLFFALLDT